jgi:Family of unknown function (DUF6599)
MISATAKRLALCFAFFAGTAFAWAERPNVISLATSSQWHAGQPEELALGSVRNWGGDPAVEAEYGVKSVERRTYTLYPEDVTVDTIVENASDISAAYGLFTFYSTESMTTLSNFPLTAMGKDTILMARGVKFIRIVALPQKNQARSEKAGSFPLTLSQLGSLVKIVGGAGPTPDDLNSLPGALPRQGLIEGTQKYLLGIEAARRVIPSFRYDLVGFTQGAEVRTARYRSGDGAVQVMAITYPTPQIAQVRFRAMQNLLGVNTANAQTFGKKMGSFVILVLNADSEVAASRILGQFSNTSYITWNERYPGSRPIVLQMVDLVLANLFFSFALAGFALVGGVLFFASKFAARKWFPNSLWGQPDEATIIKLNLR